MDSEMVGKLIYRLRRDKGLTQKQLAGLMNLSDKTVSKWERGLGCPDISLLGELSRILDVNVDKLLSGSLGCNFADSGNIQKIRFYVCPSCGSTLTATGGAEVSCCGRKLKPLTPRPVDDMHRPRVEEVENEYYITFAHEMNKTHFIRFAALVSSDRVLFVKLYPEQDAAFRCPNLTTAGALYICCSRHGLWIDRNWNRKQSLHREFPACRSLAENQNM